MSSSVDESNIEIADIEIFWHLLFLIKQEEKSKTGSDLLYFLPKHSLKQEWWQSMHPRKALNSSIGSITFVDNHFYSVQET